MEFVAIDVETSNADMASICQIGIVLYRNRSQHFSKDVLSWNTPCRLLWPRFRRLVDILSVIVAFCEQTISEGAAGGTDPGAGVSATDRRIGG